MFPVWEVMIFSEAAGVSVEGSKGFGAIDSETFKWVMMEWTAKIKGGERKD